MNKKIFLLLIVFFCLPKFVDLRAQQQLNYLRNTTGFWIGSLTPMPATSLSSRLNTNISLGLMYRRNIRRQSNLEITLSWAFLNSNTEGSVRIIPFSILYAHEFLLRTRVSIFVKAGLGSSLLDVGPRRNMGSLPTLFLGLELAIRATPSLNVGIRFDYLFLYEQNLSFTRNLSALPPGTDERFSEGQSFVSRNGHFGGINLYFTFNH